MHALNKEQSSADAKKERVSNPLSLVSDDMLKKRKSKQKMDTVAGVPGTLPELFEQYKHDVYDFIFQTIADEKIAAYLVQKVYRDARSRLSYEFYQRYAKIWFLQLASFTLRNLVLHKKQYGEHCVGVLPFDFLSLDETMVIILRERIHLSKTEIAEVLQITVGAVDQCLMRARELIGRNNRYWVQTNPFHFAPKGKNSSLQSRVRIHRALDGESSLDIRNDEESSYHRGLLQVRSFLTNLPGSACPNFAYEISRAEEKKLNKVPSKDTGWAALSWYYKLAIECSAFIAVTSFAVFILPAFLAYYEGSEATLKKAQALLPSKKISQSESFESTERSLATLPNNLNAANADYQPVEDEFAYADFPSGDNHLEGSAPLAPSRNGGAIYRLIVQSENPNEMIPKIRSLFSAANVKERDRSGSKMPGGVYFDGITTEGDYTKILSGLSAVAPTKPYNNRRRGRPDSERTRVVIWVQQI